MIELRNELQTTFKTGISLSDSASGVGWQKVSLKPSMSLNKIGIKNNQFQPLKVRMKQLTL